MYKGEWVNDKCNGKGKFIPASEQNEEEQKMSMYYIGGWANNY